MFYVFHISGSEHAGSRQDIHADHATVGRGPDCTVQFDAYRDLEVSTRHARLALNAGTLTVTDLGSTNGTFIDGVRLNPGAETAVRPGQAIRLGEAGPTLALSLTPNPPRAVAPAPAPAYAAGTPIGGGVPLHRGPAAGAGPINVRVPIGIGAAAAAGGGGMSPAGHATLGGSVGGGRAGGRGGRGRWLFSMLVLLGVIVGGAYALREMGFDTGAIARAMSASSDSVYLVLIEFPEGSGQRPRQAGTAWVVGDGLLATNAHVAAYFEQISAPLRLIARSNTSPPHDVEIVGVRIHPGYAAFDSVMAEHPRVAQRETFVNTCDVALLVVDPAHARRLSEPLRLAGDSALRGLGQGAAIGSIGFPAEGHLGGGTLYERPVAATTTGTLNKITDPFMGRAPYEHAVLLTYQFVSSGGASGSPVLSRDGRVVGLISAGNVVGQVGSARVAVGGTTLGPRVDVLRELLDGRAEAGLPERIKFWRAQLAALDGP